MHNFSFPRVSSYGNFEEFIALNGAPVEPYIIALKDHPDAKETILATPEQIGWWDEGDYADES